MNLKLRLSNYIIRYAPSEKKLREYLSRKNHTWNFYELLNELGYQESMMCVLWVRSFMAWSKWEREILEKLMKKWFPKELIRNILDDTQEELYDWEIHRSNIESSIEGMLKKWKSKRAIFIKMREKYPYFLENITLLLETKEDNFWLKNERGKGKQNTRAETGAALWGATPDRTKKYPYTVTRTDTGFVRKKIVTLSLR